jgi:hypothetical protein
LTLGVGVCTSTECLLRKGYFLLCRFSRQWTQAPISRVYERKTAHKVQVQKWV